MGAIVNLMLADYAEMHIIKRQHQGDCEMCELDQYPHEKLHAEFLTAIAESGLTEHGLGNYWSAELDVDPGAATSKVRRWKQAFPGPIVAFVCLMDLLGYRIKLEKKFEQVLPIHDLIV